MTIPLRDGSEVEDPKLGRLVQFSEESRNYQVREILEAPVESRRALRPKYWVPGPTLDQGVEGQCVAEAVTDKRNGSPLRLRPTITKYSERQEFYEEAQHRDPWPGCFRGHDGPAYGGTSVLAGMQEGQFRGYWDEYRWLGAGSGQLENDVIDTLRTLGGFVIGIKWLDGMYETDPNGLVKVEGRVVGGHALHVIGWQPKLRLPGSFTGTKPAVAWHNSWGDSYGVKKYYRTGMGFILLDDLLELLQDRGEAVVPLKKVAK